MKPAGRYREDCPKIHPMPAGHRWLKATRAVWEGWHTSGLLTDDSTDADLVAAEALLRLVDDRERATTPTARLRLSAEVRQHEKQLTRQPPKVKREWERMERTVAPNEYDPDAFPPDVRGDSDAEVAYINEMFLRFGDRWQEARWPEPPPERPRAEREALRESWARAAEAPWGDDLIPDPTRPGWWITR